MAWVVLFLSGLLECVWAVALDRSANFTRLVPSIVFVVSLMLSMAGLSWALRELPVGTAYAVWVGIGAVGTAVLGIALLGEPATAARLTSIGLIVAGIVGLKLATPT
jgi:quaternary ammonium compound-resistance protein SugE